MRNKCCNKDLKTTEPTPELGAAAIKGLTITESPHEMRAATNNKLTTP